MTKQVAYLNPMVFHNMYQTNMSIDEVFENILNFIRQDPTASYNLAIGTDSQVEDQTYFVTAVHIHRIGNGAWGSFKEYVVPRQMKSLREKISMETTLSQELAYILLSPEKIEQILDILLPNAHKGADFHYSVHIDIGRNGATRALIQEMIGRIAGMGIEAKIKPESFVASCYANRYTKRGCNDRRPQHVISAVASNQE